MAECRAHKGSLVRCYPYRMHSFHNIPTTMFTSIISWAKGLFNKNSRKAMPAQLTDEQAMDIIHDLSDNRSTWELAEEHLGKWSSLRVYRKADQEIVLVRQGEDYHLSEVRVTKGESSWSTDAPSKAIVDELYLIWLYNIVASSQADAAMSLDEYA